MAVSLISAILAAALVFAVYKLQIQQAELQKTVKVVAPKDFIEAGTMISPDMVELKSIFLGSFSKQQMFTEVDAVKGMEAQMPLGSGEPILRWKVDRYSLLPSRDQSTFQIPKEYIFSMSNGIRAGDRVRIYVSAVNGSSERLFPHQITVASVKTASNMEIDNPEQSNLLSKARGDAEKMYVSRREANGTIDQINLNLSEEEWLIIDQVCKTEDKKLVIALTSSTIMDIKKRRDGF